MPLSRSQLALDDELVASINVVDRRLSEWEIEFIDSVLKRVTSEKRELSEKQRKIAQRIQQKLDS